MARSRSLLSLNQDVLLDILSYLLVDAPPKRNRAAVLRTCTLLHELGLPLLYQVVDLRGYRDGCILPEHWETLFGQGGVLIEGGRTDELARTVKELRLGGDWSGDKKDLAADASRPRIQKVSLPSCSRLIVDLWYIENYHQSLFAPLTSQLPIRHLQIQYRPDPFDPSNEFRSLALLPLSTLSSLLFNKPSHQPWNDLQTVVFEQIIWFETLNAWSFRDGDPRPLLSPQWSFQLLVFEVTPSPSFISQHAGMLFKYLRPSGILIDTGRIELRTSGPDAGKFEEGFRKKIAEGPLDASHRRNLDLVVFVGEDGQERRLIEYS